MPIAALWAAAISAEDMGANSAMMRMGWIYDTPSPMGCCGETSRLPLRTAVASES